MDSLMSDLISRKALLEELESKTSSELSSYKSAILDLINSAPSVNQVNYTNTNHGFIMQDRNFEYLGNGYIQDNNFDYDAGLRISGDFPENGLNEYSKMICKHLNSTPTNDTLEKAAKLAENMPLNSNEEIHAYRFSNDCKAISWDIAFAIRNLKNQ